MWVNAHVFKCIQDVVTDVVCEIDFMERFPFGPPSDFLACISMNICLVRIYNGVETNTNPIPNPNPYPNPVILTQNGSRHLLS